MLAPCRSTSIVKAPSSPRRSAPSNSSSPTDGTVPPSVPQRPLRNGSCRLIDDLRRPVEATDRRRLRPVGAALARPIRSRTTSSAKRSLADELKGLDESAALAVALGVAMRQRHSTCVTKCVARWTDHRLPRQLACSSCGTTGGGPSVSHHFDSAADRADGRINPCDLYAFPAAPGTTALIVTVNPDAGRSSPTTFRPDALYEFVVASNGGTSEDLALRVSFTEPDDNGRQQVQVRRADGPAVPTFLQALTQGRYTPQAFTAAPSNTFAGRDVTAIALQLPDATLGGTRVALWARISLHGHGPQRQVSRIGQAMLRPLFFNPPDTEAQLDSLNAGAPTGDRATHGQRVRHLAATAARLAGLADPDGHAERVVAAFLPDVLGYRPGQPATFHPGGGNGRALGEDAFDIAVAVLAGSTLGTACVPRLATPAFPYLSGSQPADLPPLADYFRSPQAPGR